MMPASPSQLRAAWPVVTYTPLQWLVRILISAGEASGDMYGAQLMEALRCEAAPRPLEFFGAGGERMRAAGCEIIVDASELAVVGITEILSHLPRIWGLFGSLIGEADRQPPELAIVIDAPAFNWRVAREMKKRGVPVTYYVCPQFWAWRQGRVRLLRKYVDKALVIFPFEEKFYRDRGVNATFVGHPLAQLAAPLLDRKAYAQDNGIDPDKQWITVMPGSRMKEVRMNLPVIQESVQALGTGYEYLLPVAPTLSKEFLQPLVSTPATIRCVAEARAALAHSRAGIVASGTATIEAAMMETPFVMVYRVSPLTYFLGRPRIKVPYFAMVNLIAGEEVVPELIQDDFTANNVVSRLREVLTDGVARAKMLGGLRRVKHLLRGEGTTHTADAAKSAARLILQNHSAPSVTKSR